MKIQFLKDSENFQIFWDIQFLRIEVFKNAMKEVDE